MATQSAKSARNRSVSLAEAALEILTDLRECRAI
jgi:hypothetical protein